MGTCCQCFKSDNTKESVSQPLVEHKEVAEPKTAIKISISDFHIEKVLGEGAFGKVTLVTKKDTEQLYAMKSLRKDMIEQRNQKMHTQTEREILGEVNCPFIVQLRFAFQTTDKLFMVMDFVNGGELFFHLRKDLKFSEERTRFYSAEILTALEYLHKQGIVYRDLKPENVLLDSDGHVKLTDFGLSKKFFSGEKKTYSLCGTPEYIAPEILKGIGHDHSVDFWSFGALTYEMLSGAPPFYNRNKDIMFKDMLTKPVVIKAHFSPEAADLIRNLLQVDPKRRLSNVEEIKKHPFFNGLDWVKLQNRELEAPFKPNLSGPKDLKYFDSAFTGKNPDMSVNEKAQNSENKFPGFTYKEQGL